MTYFGEPRLGFLFKGNLVQRDVIIDTGFYSRSFRCRTRVLRAMQFEEREKSRWKNANKTL